MRYQVYEPDTLDFDFSGIIGTIGKGIVSAGSYIGKNILTQQNISTVVSGIVQKQMAKAMGKGVQVSAPRQAGAPQPSIMPYFPGPVSSPQPIIVSGGFAPPGGSAPSGGSAPAPGSILGINPLYLALGGLGIILLARR